MPQLSVIIVNSPGTPHRIFVIQVDFIAKKQTYRLETDLLGITTACGFPSDGNHLLWLTDSDSATMHNFIKNMGYSR